MPVTAGLIADIIGYHWIFLLAMALESVNLALYLSRLRETQRHRVDVESSDIPVALSAESVLLPPRRFRRVFAPLIVESFFFSMVVTIAYGMMVKEFGYSNSEIGLIISVISLSTLLGQYPATLLLLRFGPRTSLALSMVLYAVLLVGWDLSSNLLHFVLFSVVFGLSNATWIPALQSMLMTIAPPSERSSLSGKLAALRGVIAFPAPILGGFLFDKLGYHAPISVSLVGVIVTVAMIIKMLQDSDR